MKYGKIKYKFFTDVEDYYKFCKKDNIKIRVIKFPYYNIRGFVAKVS